jgi:tetratricopeptide (TPR) repeat protein
LLASDLKIIRPGEPPDMIPVPLRDSLERSLSLYQVFLSGIGNDLEPHEAIAVAQWRLAQIQNRIAWLLAKPPQSPAGDVDRAIRLAGDAVEQSPQSWAYWNTLGVARYRGGAWKSAIEALDRSRQIRREDDSYNTFFLAMAHWKLGHTDEAMKWYDQGVDWMKPYPTASELVAFRTEAAAVLGITNGSRPEAPGKAP